MEPNTKLQKKERILKNIIVFIALIIVIVLMTSCKKEDTTSRIKFAFVPYEYFDTKEEATYCRNLRPVVALLQTDIGTITANIEYVGKGWESIYISIESGMYEVYNVSLYDEEGNKTHYVYHGNPTEEIGVVTRTYSKEEYNNCIAPMCQYKYDFTQDYTMIWAVFCNWDK